VKAPAQVGALGAAGQIRPQPANPKISGTQLLGADSAKAVAKARALAGDPGAGPDPAGGEEPAAVDRDQGEERDMKEVSVNGSDLSWEQAESFSAGTMWKVLRRDSENQPLTVLLKLPPGFEMKEHSHVFVEHHFVLEGEYESTGNRYRTGSYRLIPKHSDHGPFGSETGAMVLVIWELNG
jgi:quercetin dioxygenase-like cupin family protein